jgi:hypothetical protein
MPEARCRYDDVLQPVPGLGQRITRNLDRIADAVAWLRRETGTAGSLAGT